MNQKEVLAKASEYLSTFKDTVIDVLEITEPPDQEYAIHLAKTVSKLSPLVGNMIEYQVCAELNKLDWNGLGEWERQDPGFPDTIFKSNFEYQPGIEIKTWFPNATEITARFKDSVSFFDNEQINVAVVAWLPENIIYGKPKIIDIWTWSAKSLANARDSHYHKPPSYIVLEPEDTSLRTSNLQQTNTNGYKFQGSMVELAEAKKMVLEFGDFYENYSSEKLYQDLTKRLFKSFPYRLDTNFAKIDRIMHPSLEEFKKRVLLTEMNGHTIKHWSHLLGQKNKDIMQLIRELLPAR
ncbi:MAG: hypothetical protein Q8M15_09225 [Bacteroidota bacterium]|nr:hypothetical protein [Bacteroidota bacterium]